MLTSKQDVEKVLLVLIENIPEFDGFLVDKWYFDVLYRGASVHTLRPLTLHTLTLHTLATLTAAIVTGR